MPKKYLSLLMVIMLLAASALACNTVTGGGTRDLNVDDLQATADALSLDPDAEATIAAAEETAAALSGDDTNTNGDDTNGNADDGNGNGSTDNPFDGQGPADLPVLDTNAELLVADDATLSYYTDATFDETVDFYREEMVNNGWEAAANGDVVFGGIASLQFNKDGKQAMVVITTDPTSDRTLVAITVN